MEAVAQAAGDPVALRVSALQTLDRSMPFDAWCCATLDPQSMVRTSAVSEGLPTGRAAAVAANEYMAEDVLKYAELAVSEHPVGVLGAATGGRPWTSARYRDVLAPSGFEHELRAVLRSAAGHCFGTLTLLRLVGKEDFAADEVALVTEVAPVLAEALGRSLFASADADEPPTEPGAVVFGSDGELTAMTPAARPWLSAFSRPPLMQSGAVPYPLRAIALQTLASGEGAKARLPVGAGWAILHASPLADLEERLVGATVVVAPAEANEIAALAAAAFALSAREWQIAERLIEGSSTDEIARELFLSAYTVQDHVKELFRKLEVNSRSRVVARLLGRPASRRRAIPEEGPSKASTAPTSSTPSMPDRLR